MEEVEDNTSAASLKNKKAYVHPFDNDHYSVNMSPVRTSEMFYEFVGPEQVSPHYESFLASRKWAIGFWATCFGLSYVSTTLDFHWVAKSCIVPFVFYGTTFYWVLEGRKHIIKPLFNRWYRLLALHDMKNIGSYWKDQMRINVGQNMHHAREQMDYYLLHRNYNTIKAESINRFLAHEQMNLQKHINVRTHNLLKAAKSAETGNRRALVNKIVAKALDFLDEQMKGDLTAVNDAIFESALIGISKGSMTYENDPLLPMVTSMIKAEVAKITDLSEAEQQQLVALTEMQLNNLRKMDETAKREYLDNCPKLDAMTMQTDAYQKMAANWGN